MNKNKAKYIGKWHTAEMEMWDREFIDSVTPGYFRLNKEIAGEVVGEGVRFPKILGKLPKTKLGGQGDG
jgi:hypothetical protein